VGGNAAASVRLRARARNGLRVCVDFDGTVALGDVTDAVLERFAAADWEAVEAAWVAGEIDAATCMRRQIALIEAPMTALEDFLDRQELEPSFPKFAAWCRDVRIPLAIVSDGVEDFARRILARHGLDDIPLYANRLKLDAGRYALAHPWRERACLAGSGVCKCAIAIGADSPSRPITAYVGDGRSDRCVAAHADQVFAKDSLAAHCAERGIAHLPWKSFDDVRSALSAWLQEIHTT